MIAIETCKTHEKSEDIEENSHQEIQGISTNRITSIKVKHCMKNKPPDFILEMAFCTAPQ